MTNPPAPQRPTAELLSDLRNQIAAITSKWMSTEQLADAAGKLAETAAEVDARLSVTLATLTASDLRVLAELDRATETTARVARRVNESGDVVEGVARHFTVDERGAFPGPNDDVRTCLLRVTGTTSIGEFFWPLTEVMAELVDGTFVVLAA